MAHLRATIRVVELHVGHQRPDHAQAEAAVLSPAGRLPASVVDDLDQDAVSDDAGRAHGHRAAVATAVLDRVRGRLPGRRAGCPLRRRRARAPARASRRLRVRSGRREAGLGRNVELERAGGGGGELEHEERDVVAQAPPGPRSSARIVSASCSGSLSAGTVTDASRAKPVVDRLADPLDQPVRVEHHQRAGLQAQGSTLEREVDVDSEREVATLLDRTAPRRLARSRAGGRWPAETRVAASVFGVERGGTRPSRTARP